MLMDIKSLEELRRPDDRTLHFAPLGLGGKMRAEDAAVFQQEVISHVELVPAVAEGTRNSFDRLRALYAYGVLNYDIFTIVEDQAHLVLEHALRERFLDFYNGAVPMEDGAGQPHTIQAARVGELFKEIRKGSRLRGSQRRRLRLRRTGELIEFDGMSTRFEPAASSSRSQVHRSS
jgi:hypothetical protein